MFRAKLIGTAIEVLAEVLDTMDIGTDGCLGEVCGVATPQSSAHVDGSQRGPPSLRPKLLVSLASVYECFPFTWPYNALFVDVADDSDPSVLSAIRKLSKPCSRQLRW